MAARKLLLGLGAASLLAATALTAHAQDPASCPASLRLVDSSPVTFAGSGFCAGERMRVRARAGDERRSRRVRANENGSFRVRFRHLPYDPCSSDLSASAGGPGGVRASYKRPQRMCPMPLRDDETPADCRGADLEDAPPPPRCNVP